eukprot:2188996-Rhodomonas_salina.1
MERDMEREREKWRERERERERARNQTQKATLAVQTRSTNYKRSTNSQYKLHGDPNYSLSLPRFFFPFAHGQPVSTARIAPLCAVQHYA